MRIPSNGFIKLLEYPKIFATKAGVRFKGKVICVIYLKIDDNIKCESKVPLAIGELTRKD